MDFKFENLGPIKKAKLTLGNLTIINGKNNTGKTYLAYGIYGLLSTWKASLDILNFEKHAKELWEKKTITIQLEELKSQMPFYFNQLSAICNETLYQTFNANEIDFEKTSINFSIPNFDFPKENFSSYSAISKRHYIHIQKQNNLLEISLGELPLNENLELGESPVPYGLNTRLRNNIIRFLFHGKMNTTYVMTSERTGIQLFQKELDLHKNALVDQLVRKKNNQKNPIDFLEKATARYSLPIQANIDFVRDSFEHTKKNSELYLNSKEVVEEIEKMLDVKYLITEEGIYLKPRNSQKAIPLHLGSTSTRALLSLYIYSRFLAKENDILIIDEPEINLHPENQIMLARVISKLVNSGIKIIITTHSDYIVKELNNLMALSNDFETKKAVMKKFDYKQNEILDPNTVKAYLAENNTATEIKIDNYGLERTTFDKALDQLNESSEEIAFGINE